MKPQADAGERFPGSAADSGDLVVSALVMYPVMAGLALGLARWGGTPLPGWTASPGEALAAVGVALVAVAGSRLAARRSRALGVVLDDMAEVLSGLSLPAALGLAVVSAAGEEMLFRGVLLAWWGLLPSSLVFALLHWPYRPEARAWTGFALAMGLVLGALAEGTGSLGPPFLCHALVNAMNLPWIAAMGRDREGAVGAGSRPGTRAAGRR